MMKTILCLMAVGVAVAAGARDRGSYVAEWVDGFQIGLLNATAQQGGWGPHTRFLLRVGLFNVAYYKSGDPTCWPLMTLEW